MIQSPRLRQALAYAAVGIPIFPCTPGGKRPVTPHAFRDATTDTAVIAGWWAEADYNLALCPEDAGWCVVDIDLPEIPADLDLPATRTVITPRGGRHLYYIGRLPTGASRLAPHIDTRGVGGYALVPPSIVDGRPYRVIDDTEIAPLPAWIGERLKSRDLPRLAAPDGVVLDAEWMVDLAKAELRDLVRRGDVAAVGNRDDMTFKIACKMLELGLSQEKAAELMHAIWEPACEDLCSEHDDLIEWKLASAAGGSMQNEAGSKALPDPASWKTEQYALPPAEPQKPARRYAWRKPSEDAKLPPLAYWDEDRMLPRIPGGCFGVLAAPKESHKTGLMLKKCADAVFNKGARVLYIATEGANGIMTSRLPKLCEQRGKRIDDLDNHWRTIEVSPNLLLSTDIDDLITHCRNEEFSPDLIVFDVGTRAVPGADINAPMVGIAIALSAEKLGRTFNAAVVYVTHPGPNGGSIGSKMVDNLAFFIWTLAYEGGVVRAWVDRMKDGPAQFTVPYRVQSGGVPVVIDVSAEERAVILNGGAVHDETRDRVFEHAYNRIIAGQPVNISNSGWGPSIIAADLRVTEPDVRKCLDELTARGWLIKGTKGDGYQLGNQHRRPGSLSD